MTTAHALRVSEAVDKSREQLRDEHRVRLVNSAEEGVPLHSLPAGVYGFTYAPASHEAGLFAKASYLSFEIHKTSSQGTQIVGFVTEQEAGNLDYAVDCELFPEARDTARTLVSVAASRIIGAKALARDRGNCLRLRLRAPN